MEHLTGHNCDGYGHPNEREPYWNVDDYAIVREAAYFFAGVAIPMNDGKTIEADIEAIARRSDLQPTEREALILARRGQGNYRKELLALWGGQCAVTGLALQAALVASHAKPWADSTDQERLDPCNGLPLTATLDRLFDQYLIAFAPESGEMVISRKIAEPDRAILGIPAKLREIPNARQAHFLKLHLKRFEAQKSGTAHD